MSNLDLSSIPPGQLQDVLDRPALLPPEGVVPNFDNPPNKNTLELGVQFTCLGVATIFLLVRFYVRLVVMKKTHLGDCE